MPKKPESLGLQKKTPAKKTPATITFTVTVARTIVAGMKLDMIGRKNMTYATPTTAAATHNLSSKAVARGLKKTLESNLGGFSHASGIWRCSTNQGTSQSIVYEHLNRTGRFSHMKKYYRPTQLVSLVVIILFAHCLSVRSQTTDKPKSAGEVALIPQPLIRIDEIEDKNKLLYPRGGSVDWGLALSGGGIRSGSYSVGVMKALYDSGLFEELDAISTVSGGGYASYWLYGLYDPSDNLKFGESAFSTKSFLENTCDLQNVANMYPLSKMAKSFFKSRAGAFDDYRKAIHRTFGVQNKELKERTVHFYRDSVKDGRAPYFFVNASMYSQELVDVAKAIEITPEHIGNPVLGYSRWSDGAAINFGDSIALAAAGKPKVRNDVANFAPNVLCLKKKPSQTDDEVDLGRTECKRGPLALWDGGHSENLGALPLIRRGIKNVIIIDAEHDPNYIYDAYFDLQRILRSIGIDFCVPEIDGCGGRKANRSTHETGVMKGNARNKVTGTETTVFYLKMMRPLNIFPGEFETYFLDAKNTEQRRERIQEKYEVGYNLQVERDKKIGKDPTKRKSKVNCVGVADVEADPDMYRYGVNDYGYFIIKSKLRQVSSRYRDLAYDFPHTTTFDQSYYADQMEAFIGLGFLQGTALSKMIGKVD